MHEEAQYDELRSKLFIDAMRMDEELIQHPMILQTVTEFAADAMQIRDLLKSHVEVVTAETASRLRSVTGKDGKPPSEARIASELPMFEAIRDAQAEYEAAKHDYNYWSGLVESYREKGGSLKRIAELTIAGFLAPNMARRKEMAEKRNAT